MRYDHQETIYVVSRMHYFSYNGHLRVSVMHSHVLLSYLLCVSALRGF